MAHLHARFVFIAFTCCAAALLHPLSAVAQRIDTTSPLPPRSGSSMDTDRTLPHLSPPDMMADADNGTFATRIAEARKLERKKRMLDNAKRLVELTQAFQSDLQTRGPLPADEKRLDEIARLARLVREGMQD